jgi:hypothetical protein
MEGFYMKMLYTSTGEAGGAGGKIVGKAPSVDMIVHAADKSVCATGGETHHGAVGWRSAALPYN